MADDEVLDTPFFAMPIGILKSFHDEFEFLTGAKVASGILFRCGFRGGESEISKLELRADKDEKLGHIIRSIWAEIGLGRMLDIKLDDDIMELEIEESVEARAMERTGRNICDFNRGYLAGIVSELTQIKYHCEEERCVSAGDPICEFKLYQI